MATNDGADWSKVNYTHWTDLSLIRGLLDAGADPHAGVYLNVRPLHAAAEYGSPEVVAELARRVDDVDAEHEGRTALWTAVFADRPGNARVLLEAGADPSRPMMAGWSPARLGLATPTPDLFSRSPDEAGLTAAEAAAVTEARRLIAALGDFDYDGLSLACVAGINAAEAVRRLGAEPADPDEIEEIMDDPWSDLDANAAFVGVTDVPGGCVVTQPWGYTASDPGVTQLLSAGTVCYAMYANPKSGNQGSMTRDGVIEEWDDHPGGGSVSPGNTAEEILTIYLYDGEALADRCAGAGLRLTDARAITGPPDLWLKLPQHLC
ncbi:ankyrin repeat domain-containing protein [Nonomuraea sp. NPDC002799]